jgi:uncharacterized protein YfiM (DUF2279 family)
LGVHAGADAGQLQVRGEGRVVVADYSDVPSGNQTLIAQGAKQADGEEVVDRKDSRGRLRMGQQLFAAAKLWKSAPLNRCSRRRNISIPKRC